jgi:hypothetical protein
MEVRTSQDYESGDYTNKRSQVDDKPWEMANNGRNDRAQKTDPRLNQPELQGRFVHAPIGNAVSSITSIGRKAGKFQGSNRRSF